jgi:DNA-binding CsgD family transcriptional regulator
MDNHQLTKPCIVIVESNILAALGLKSMIESMAPLIDVISFPSLEALKSTTLHHVVHYFVSENLVGFQDEFFKPLAKKLIVLTYGQVEQPSLPGLRYLDVCVPEPVFLKGLLDIHGQGHGVGNPHSKRPMPESTLTRRENEVLRLAVMGLQNKEIAECFHIALNTVIYHRKNIARKLDNKSLSNWTIYAVVNGLVRMEDLA